jgi:hypothetical protein
MREALMQGSLSNSEYLNLLYQARDQITWAIDTGEPITYLEIRSRRVQLSDPRGLLDLIVNKLIPKYEQIVGREAGHSTRNYAVLKKPTQPTARKGN